MMTPPIFVKIVLMHNQMIFNGTVKIFHTALRIAAPAFLMFVTHAGKGWHTTARDGRDGFSNAPMVMGKAQLTLWATEKVVQEQESCVQWAKKTIKTNVKNQKRW